MWRERVAASTIARVVLGQGQAAGGAGPAGGARHRLSGAVTAPHFRLDPKRIDYLLARGLEITAAGIEALIGSDGVFTSDHALVWSDCTTIATGQDADQTSTGDASART